MYAVRRDPPLTIRRPAGPRCMQPFRLATREWSTFSLRRGKRLLSLGCIHTPLIPNSPSFMRRENSMCALLSLSPDLPPTKEGPLIINVGWPSLQRGCPGSHGSLFDALALRRLQGSSCCKTHRKVLPWPIWVTSLSLPQRRLLHGQKCRQSRHQSHSISSMTAGGCCTPCRRGDRQRWG